LKKIFSLSSVLIFGFITAIILSSCATLFNGQSVDTVSFSSDPDGARVYVNGNLSGKTPFLLSLNTKISYALEFKKDGYENKTILLNNSVGGGWIVLDILGGILPLFIDIGTGAWYGLEQDQVHAVLEQQHH
jgi:PEGA domain